MKTIRMHGRCFGGVWEITINNNTHVGKGAHADLERAIENALAQIELKG